MHVALDNFYSLRVGPFFPKYCTHLFQNMTLQGYVRIKLTNIDLMIFILYGDSKRKLKLKLQLFELSKINMERHIPDAMDA